MQKSFLSKIFIGGHTEAIPIHLSSNDNDNDFKIALYTDFFSHSKKMISFFARKTPRLQINHSKITRALLHTDRHLLLTLCLLLIKMDKDRLILELIINLKVDHNRSDLNKPREMMSSYKEPGFLIFLGNAKAMNR